MLAHANSWDTVCQLEPTHAGEVSVGGTRVPCKGGTGLGCLGGKRGERGGWGRAGEVMRWNHDLIHLWNHAVPEKIVKVIRLIYVIIAGIMRCF